MESLLRRGTHNRKPRNMGNPVLPTSSFTRHLRHVTSEVANGQQQDQRVWALARTRFIYLQIKVQKIKCELNLGQQL